MTSPRNGKYNHSNSAKTFKIKSSTNDNKEYTASRTENDRVHMSRLPILQI